MDYNTTVDKVMYLLKQKGGCSSSRKSHKDCYFSFAQFLEQMKQEYSEEAKDSWLAWMKDKFPRQRCMVWNQYMYQLEEMAETGAISDRRLYLNRSNYFYFINLFSSSYSNCYNKMLYNYIKQ